MGIQACIGSRSWSRPQDQGLIKLALAADKSFVEKPNLSMNIQNTRLIIIQSLVEIISFNSLIQSMHVALVAYAHFEQFIKSTRFFSTQRLNWKKAAVWRSFLDT